MDFVQHGFGHLLLAVQSLFNDIELGNAFVQIIKIVLDFFQIVEALDQLDFVLLELIQDGRHDGSAPSVGRFIAIFEDAARPADQGDKKLFDHEMGLGH